MIGDRHCGQVVGAGMAGGEAGVWAGGGMYIGGAEFAGVVEGGAGDGASASSNGRSMSVLASGRSVVYEAAGAGGGGGA